MKRDFEAGRPEKLTRAEEKRLVEQARSGNNTALRKILREVSGPAYRFGRTFCKHHDDAEDVMQDVLATVVRRLDTFRGESSLSSWAWVVARNACARMRRRRKGQPAAFDSLDAEPLNGGALQIAAPGADPSRAVEAGEIREALRMAIADLPKAHREAVLLRDVEGMSAEQAAKVLRINVRALKSRLHRGRTALRAALQPYLEKKTLKPTPECPDIAAAASRYLEGEVPASVCAQLEAHIAQCPECKARCRAFQKMMKLCRTFGDVAPAPGARLTKVALDTLQGS